MKSRKLLKIILITLLILVFVCGIGFLYLYHHGLSGMVSQNSKPASGRIKVACVGDSITYGHGIKDWSKNNYPAVLQNLLGDGYHVQNFGVSGRAVQDNSDQPYRAVQQYQDSIAYDADILIFMMGSNDTKPENWFGEDAFKSAMIDLLDDYTQGEDKPQIYICTTPSCYFLKNSTGEQTNFGLRPAYAEIAANIAQEVADAFDYPVIDIHTLTAENPQWFETDGVHPDNDGAAAIAMAVYQAITGA